MKQYITAWVIGNLALLSAFFIANTAILNYTGKVWQMGYIEVPKTYDPAIMKAAQQLADNGIADPEKLMQSFKNRSH